MEIGTWGVKNFDEKRYCKKFSVTLKVQGGGIRNSDEKRYCKNFSVTEGEEFTFK